MVPLDEQSLKQFHPGVAEWFHRRVGTPTDVQAAAWPRVAAGEHVLITAPTGSGKTLTAFLWALNQLIVGEYPRGQCSVLYVSPLKALNNDIQRNLLSPLRDLRAAFGEAGEDFPAIRVLTRSGDTPASERRAMQRKPPEILITTPESLNLLLSSRGGTSMLGALRTVILDEIHAVVDSKRGVHLMTAVERLTRLSGEFQRIALSATVRPLELVAEFVGGFQRLGGEQYAPRPVEIIRSARTKTYQVLVDFPEHEANDEGVQSMWPPIISGCREIIQQNRSTLIFTNTRRLAETITWKINAEEPELLAYAHHGSLSREIRSEVEHRLKSGRLKAIVATNSLEMGIDIGALDEVVLIQSPPGIAAAIQRVGRAGHQVGEASRATLYPTHGQDLLAAAVLAPNILGQNIEQARAVRCPLDVLAQVIVSMTGMARWDVDDLYAEIRCSYPYHTLTRAQFELVLEMLAGRYAETRIRDLSARISLDRLDNTVEARPGALQTLYTSGGTIPDRGYFRLRHLESGALIGELDEEYVWEARVGQALNLGTQSWRIERITHNDVFVVPAGAHSRQAPFWKGDDPNRDAHFSEQIGLFLERASARLEDPDYPAELQRDHCLTAQAAEALIEYLQRQQDFTGCELPHRRHLLVEQVEAGPDGFTGNQVILHTFWGGRVNLPYSLALAAAWDERFGEQLEVYPTNDAIYLVMTGEVSSEELLALVSSDRVEELLRRQLEGSGFFGARFRECAGRALLLTRRKIGERMPLWVNRLRAKKLFEAVQGFGDFPMLLEAWRTCLQDEFDLDRLRALLVECETGEMRWSEVRGMTPSPFAMTASWRQIDKYMYMDDTPAGRTGSRLRTDLLQEVVFSPELRPAIAAEVSARFTAKRQRTAPGYAPQSPRDLLDWVKERLLIPLPEWQALLEAVERDHGLDAETLLKGNTGKLARVQPSPDAIPLIAAVESLPRVLALWEQSDTLTVSTLTLNPLSPRRGGLDELSADDEGASSLLGEWLSFYGPVAAAWVAATLGVSEARLTVLLDDLLETQRVIQGRLRDEGGEDDLCDSENFQVLLRMARAAAVPEFTPLPATEIPHFLARYHGLTARGEGIDDLWERMQQLSGYAAKAELWEEVIFPARLRPYETVWLDSILQEGNLHWVGAEKGRVAFCLHDDVALWRESPSPRGEGGSCHPDKMPDILSGARGDARAPFGDDLRDLLPDQARYPLNTLAAASKVSMQELVARLWDGVWRGVISNDTALALRRGIATGFQAPQLPEVNAEHRQGRKLPRGSFNRWSAATPFAGNWYRLPEPLPVEDQLDQGERAKERVRILLGRYGILFRELLQGETPAFQWPAIFRALRLMELSGELLAGCFFHGIPGLQFIAHPAFRLLRRTVPGEVWWVNACDPASCCGLPLAALKGTLPRRVSGNFVVYRDAEVAAVIERNGKDLTFHAATDDPQFPDYLEPLRVLLERRFQPQLKIVVEQINGDNPCHSPYLDRLQESFDVVRDMNRVFLGKRLR